MSFDPFNPKYARIELSNKPGLFFIVDKEDEARVRQHKWDLIRKTRQIITYIDGKTVYIGRFILQPEDPKAEVDHRSGNQFNNSKENLRICTHQQNLFNQQKMSGASSYELGVDWLKAAKKWRARIRFNGCEKHLGLYNTEIEAARAYNEAAKELFGEFANPNTIEEDK